MVSNLSSQFRALPSQMPTNAYEKELVVCTENLVRID